MVYKATKNLNLSRNNKAIFSDKCSTYCFLIVNAEVLRQNCFPRPSARPTLRLSHVNSIPLSLGRSMVILFYKQKRLTNFALILHFYMEVVGTRFFSLSRYHYLARCHQCEAKLGIRNNFCDHAPMSRGQKDVIGIRIKLFQLEKEKKYVLQNLQLLFPKSY